MDVNSEKPFSGKYESFCSFKSISDNHKCDKILKLLFLWLESFAPCMRKYRTSFHLIVLRFHSHFVPQFKPIAAVAAVEKLNKMFMFCLVCLFTWFFNSGSCFFFFFFLIVLLLLLFVTSLKRFSLSDDQVQLKTLLNSYGKRDFDCYQGTSKKNIW